MVMQARPAHVHDQGLAKDDARWVKQTVTVANRTYALLITAVAECPKQRCLWDGLMSTPMVGMFSSNANPSDRYQTCT
jgi:hypothetical protein